MNKIGKDRDIIDLTHLDQLLKEASLKPVFQLTPLFGIPGYTTGQYTILIALEWVGDMPFFCKVGKGLL